MSSTFNFHGQTTFINKPKDSVINDFQNAYITGADNDEQAKVNKEILGLIEHILNSKEISDENKNESVDALHKMAADVKEKKVNKITFKGTLESIKEIVTKAADIATPAIAVIKTILAFFA
jgi:hypothetical protein